ncbi:MAG: [FeFe] hydrogenase H-cluster radical SAM maturase HydG [Sedimentisphaerales bacterium]|nr:[FeFe] hydrogenase H-cluster radical SAM maturase HydG [Sedimentisphaerales bacterium]
MNTTHTIESNKEKSWSKRRIIPQEISKYLNNGRCFIDADRIEDALKKNNAPEESRVREILQKSLTIETLSLSETACLLNVENEDLIAEMEQTAAEVKRRVYDNRIVTFAPLYLSNYCVNDCLYCGFRRSNTNSKRRALNPDEIEREVQVLAGQIGHKRLIVVYGEHPKSDVNYIASSIQTIANVQVKTKHGTGQIRRCNINAAPMSVEELKLLHQIGIGTFQVFQETYHRDTYEALHPQNTVKGNYLWRLYCMHRAMEAGCDDVGIGVLFGLYDWKFEVMALLQHAVELEDKFGIGPHTISFPRMEPADNTPYTQNTRHPVSDRAFRRLVTAIRLAVPYTGMILTARENAEMRRQMLSLGCTQTDASSRIGIGAYADATEEQQGDKQQFILGDIRSLDAVVRELAESGYITSFCTAGYRCGRTGKKIMDLLRTGCEGHFCKLNAIITFREWLDDFASEQTKQVGEKVIEKEIAEVKEKLPSMYPQLMNFYQQTKTGKRDIYF